MDFFGAAMAGFKGFKQRNASEWRNIVQAQARELQAVARKVGKTLNEFIIAAKVNNRGDLSTNVWVKQTLAHAGTLWKCCREMEGLADRILGKFSALPSEVEKDDFIEELNKAFGSWQSNKVKR